MRGGITKKKIIGTSTKKYWVRSQIFRYGLPEDFLNKWQKTERHAVMQTCRQTKWFLVLHFAAEER